MTTHSGEGYLKDLGRQISGRLVGCTPRAWWRWSLVVNEFGLRHALDHARTLARDEALDPGSRQSFRTIYRVVSKFRKALSDLPRSDLMDVLFYALDHLYGRRLIPYR